ncbi:MAG: SRPBCC family protein [Minwuia sp.]|uniref:SRPBCC family protein n=1 Tax=Minwuia sp. TaxID=2493630 RepID=UPI003A8BD6FF
MTAEAADVRAEGDIWRCAIERRFAAPVSQVWRAFCDPARVAAWYGPEGMEAEIEQFDFREGGEYRLVMRAGDGGEYPLKGRFLTIEEGRKLVMTWLWLMPEATGIETLVTIELAADGDGTFLKLVHEKFADADNAAGHGEGWYSSLRCLEAYLVESAGR